MNYDPINVNGRDFFFDALDAIRRRGGRPVGSLGAYVGLGDISAGWKQDAAAAVERRERLNG